MRGSPRFPRATGRSPWAIVVVVAALLVLLAWSFGRGPQADRPPAAEASEPAGPPWRYGRSDARFTVVEYADLECPHCKAYFQVLKRWIDTHADVNWQWHHLPLPMHEPAATRGARLAECAGEVGGTAAFWNAVAWIHQHTLGGGQGLPADARLPGATPALHECLASARPDAVIHAQAEEAIQTNVVATPTLRVIDNHTGRSLLLPAGPVEGDVLLSALDLLAASHDDSPLAEPASGTAEIPADSVSDTSR